MDWFVYYNGLRHERGKSNMTELGSGGEGVCQRNSLASYEGEGVAQTRTCGYKERGDGLKNNVWLRTYFMVTLTHFFTMFSFNTP